MSTTQTQVVHSYTIQVVGQDVGPQPPSKAPDVPSSLQTQYCVYGWKIACTLDQLRKMFPTIKPESPIHVTAFFRAQAKDAGINRGVLVKLLTFKPGADGCVAVVIKLARNYTLDLSSEDGDLWLRVDDKRRNMIPPPDLMRAFTTSLGLGPATWFAVDFEDA